MVTLSHAAYMGFLDKWHTSQRGNGCAADLDFYKKLGFPMSLQAYYRDQPTVHVKGVLTLLVAAHESRLQSCWGVGQHFPWEAESLQTCPLIFPFSTEGNKIQNRHGFLSKQVCSLRSVMTEISIARVKTQRHMLESQRATNSKTRSVLEGGKCTKSNFAGHLPQNREPVFPCSLLYYMITLATSAL